MISEICHEIRKKISAETVLIMRHNGFNDRVTRRNLYIEEIKRGKILAFAEKFIKKPRNWWNDVTLLHVYIVNIAFLTRVEKV